MPVFSAPHGILPAAVAGDSRLRRLTADLRAYYCIIYALIMHDIKNRFFGSGLGQIVMVLWPFVHILVLLAVFIVRKAPNPYGPSLLHYTAISIFPFICFNYVLRWITYSAMTNRPYLQYPIVKPLDIIVARTILEIVSITMVAILIIILLVVTGNDPMPADKAQAVYAVLATIFLAIGIGVPSAVVTFIFPLWNLIVILVILSSYVASGIVFVVSDLPEQFRVPLSYNPLLHCTEWLRLAYYSDYPDMVLDKTYLLEVSFTSLTFGLILERLLRRFI